MVHIQARMPASEAVTPEERESVWTSGPDEGYFFISQNMMVEPQHENGVYDFREAYLEGLRQFMNTHPRVAEGRMNELTIS